MLSRHVSEPVAWLADTPLPNDGVIQVSHAARVELSEAAAFLERNPLPIPALDVGDFDLPECAAMMLQVKQVLDHGIGFAILNELPWNAHSADICKALHWLMMSMLGRTVAQKWNGEMVYDVQDTGRKEAVGAGVRGSKTNGRQGYHTDNSYNLPPDYVGLACLKTAMEGGLSGLVSFYSAHNMLLEHHKALLPRLYEPFLFERYDEFAPGENPVSEAPIFSYDGAMLGVRLSTRRVRTGYEAAGQVMDSRTEDALATLDSVLENKKLGKTFEFLPGQTQIVNNRKLGHRRTAFVDWPEPDRKRHLVRVWVRHHGRRFYAG